MEIDSYAIGYQNGYKDAEDKYKPKELDLERKEVIRTLNKLANDYLVYPNETKALDYAIRDLEKPSIIDVLDKIRDEIGQMDFDFGDFYDHTYVIKEMVLEVIDKYREKSEEGIEK